MPYPIEPGQSDAPPVHIIGAGQSLDKRSESGRPRLAPHSLLQEYLNRTDHVWGMVTNGLTLRLLRNSQLIRRHAYLEVDLSTVFAGEGRFADFALLYRLIHRSRFPHTYGDTKSCLLERWFQHTVEQGGRVREKLREGVEKAIPQIANGILRHPQNAAILEQARSGELTATELYQELLRLIYRWLFLMVTEERNLLTTNTIYRERYSISRFRRLCENRQARNRHVDLWAGLQSTFRLFQVEDYGKVLDVPPLNGDLFDLTRTEHLNDAALSNRDFLDALWHLSLYREDNNAPPRHVNYSALDVEELGSVYEGLLELQPTFAYVDGQLSFDLIPGLERKGTGSYYTRPELVDELLKSALLPVLADRLRHAGTSREREKRLLEMSVCDPACGSGHFLLAASRRLARELAKIRSGEDEPSPVQYRIALRDVIAHCIYGVDKNPLAVELCKVALWLESYIESKPLSFLDHRIQVGNSLVGVWNLGALKDAIPEDAYKPVTGDNRDVARDAKAANKRQLKGQMRIFAPDLDLGELGKARHDLAAIPDDTPDLVRQKRVLLNRFRSNAKYEKDRNAANLWTLAFFARLTEENVKHGIPLTDHVREALEGRNPDPQLVAEATAEANRLFFFHWPLEFPEVFSRGGFDVLLSNPPWERIKIQQQEFFASRDLNICHAPNKSQRESLIGQLPHTNAVLWAEYQMALHDVESTGKLLRTGGEYPDTGRGDINTYSVFAERLTCLARPTGTIGACIPTGIATDYTNRFFFSRLASSARIVSLFSFQEVRDFFRGTEGRQPFCLLTVSGSGVTTTKLARFCFGILDLAELTDSRRVFELEAADFERLNPNTKTCPIFRTRADAELSRRIYSRFPVLLNEATGTSPWGVTFGSMFHMSNDSGLFKRQPDLEAEGYRLCGNRFTRNEEIYLPLYEAKMVHQFDHRFGSFQDLAERPQNTGLPTPSESDYGSASYIPLPWYWVAENNLDSVAPWFVGFRKTARAGDERTVMVSVVPRSAINDKLPLIAVEHGLACLIANFNSLVFDYCARQKLGGTDLTNFYVKQFPIIPPDAYTPADRHFIVPRVAELVGTAWDIQPFLDYLWSNSDPTLQKVILDHWDANRLETGGHPANPPDWYVKRNGLWPRPRFKWKASRRAGLRAELDAYYARLYKLNLEDLQFILDPQSALGADYPSETFRVLKEKEIAKFGEYQTQRLVLEAWSRLERGELL